MSWWVVSSPVVVLLLQDLSVLLLIGQFEALKLSVRKHQHAHWDLRSARLMTFTPDSWSPEPQWQTWLISSSNKKSKNMWLHMIWFQVMWYLFSCSYFCQTNVCLAVFLTVLSILLELQWVLCFYFKLKTYCCDFWNWHWNLSTGRLYCKDAVVKADLIIKDWLIGWVFVQSWLDQFIVLQERTGKIWYSHSRYPN